MKQHYFGRDLEAMSFAANYHQWIVEEFTPYLGDHIAEVGAGSGNFTKLLCNTRLTGKIDAFEPSENMYKILSKKYTNVGKVTPFNCIFLEKHHTYQSNLDSVLYVNVLEHIKDDARELRLAYATLKPGGHLLLFVPALEFLFSNLDSKLGHFRRYNKNSLGKLVSETGFEILKIKYFDLLGILPWYIVFVLLKSNITDSKVSLYDKVVIPIMRKIENKFKPPIGKNLLLIARKPKHTNP